jgi:hypothetical protein
MYFDKEAFVSERDKILREGFSPDVFLGRPGLPPTCGLNVVMAWPLPEHFRLPYEALARQLSELDPGIVVYPFDQTHITLVTVVNFRDRMNPSPELVREIRSDAGRLTEHVRRIAGNLTPFRIDVGPPITGRQAVFLPILNPGGEVRYIRESVMTFCSRSERLADARVPGIIHSTIARYRSAPCEPSGLLKSFETVARSTAFGCAVIDEILVTLETRPYMNAGERAGRVQLRGAAVTSSPGTCVGSVSDVPT